MLYVTSLDGINQEPLIDIGVDFKVEQSVDGAFSASFTTYPSEYNPGYQFLVADSIVTIEDNEFIVKQCDDTGFSKRVNMLSTFFEHSKTQVVGIFSGNHTLQNHLAFAFQGSGWSFIIDPDIANVTNYISNYGNDSVVGLVNRARDYHTVEFIILPNKVVKFSKQIGPDNDEQYTYGNNISDVVSMEDTTNLYTYIRGIGFEGLEVSWTSPNYGKFGKKEAPVVRDDRFKDAVAFTNYLKNSIKDEPEITIESKVPELTKRETGERVWLIYPPLGMKLATRILKQTKVIRDGKLVTDGVTLGNTLRKTSTDSTLDQLDHNQEAEDKLEDAKSQFQENLYLQWQETEERIIDQYQTITSEYNASISVSAREIRTEMTQKETNINNTIGAQYTKITTEYNSAISQTAQQLRIDYEAKITAVNGDVMNVWNYASRIEQSANQIQSTVQSQQIQINGQDTRISTAESRITQNANNINLSVRKDNVISSINLSPESITLNANRINFNGHVFGQGSTWAGNISTSMNAYVGNNLYLGQSFGGSKGIWFNNSATITTRYSSDINISAETFSVPDSSNINLSEFANNNGYVKSRTSGIEITQSSNNSKRIVVKINGYDIGGVTLT